MSLATLEKMKKALKHLEQASIELYSAKNAIIDLDIVDQRKLNTIIIQQRSFRVAYALKVKNLDKAKCSNCGKIPNISNVIKSIDFPEAVFCSRKCRKVWEQDGY